MAIEKRSVIINVRHVVNYIICDNHLNAYFNLVSKSFDCVVNSSLLFALLTLLLFILILLLLFPFIPSVKRTSLFCCNDDWSVGISKRFSSSGSTCCCCCSTNFVCSLSFLVLSKFYISRNEMR
jgi:ABC-type sulfate transport system permease component